MPGPTLPRRIVLGGLALAATPRAPARAAETSSSSWPTRAVRVVVPFPPGSTPDLVARVVAEHFRAALGQPFVADNRAGAGGTIGTDAVAKAADDHTIGVSINGPIATAAALYPSLPYDPARDLAYVSLLVRAPQLLVVHPSVPARDLPGLVTHARANPGRLSYGSVGPGSASHLAMEDLRARTGGSGGDAGLDLVHVPYKGFPEATVDLVAGRIEAMFVIVGAVLPQVRDGRLRALAVTADARLPQAPEVPTLAEAGVPDAANYAWIGLIAPAGTPGPVVARLAGETRAALADPARRGSLEAAGYEIVASSPDEFATFAAAETERWGGLVRRLGITAGQ